LGDHPGFDMISYRTDGETRLIEVKGRAQSGNIDISENEWSAACNHREKYWLYVVYNCAIASPRPITINDPLGACSQNQGYVLEETEILGIQNKDYHTGDFDVFY